MLATQIFLVSICLLVAESQAANILLLPILNGSHYNEIEGVGRPLIARGHNVYVVLDDSTAMPKGSPFQLITYRSRDPLKYRFERLFNHRLIEDSKAGINVSMLWDMQNNMCTDMMSDPQLFPKLRSLNLDVVVMDNGPLACFFLTPYVLGVPFVTVSSVLISWTARVPVLPSVAKASYGLDMYGFHACQETDDQWRIVRIACRLMALYLQEKYVAGMQYEYLKPHVNFHLDGQLLHAIRENVSLTLINSAILLSDPLPKLPQVEYVGGLTTRPPKPLDADLEKWMSQAANVIVVSYGSMFTSLPPSLAEKVFEAFGRLSKYRFLMRFKLAELGALKVPTNVLLMNWMPQFDALGHNSTIAFITHSGNNGQLEALYHGKPMLCFYIHADQKNNAKRVAVRGYGKMMDYHSITADRLVLEIEELIENKSYRERIQKASRIFHSEKHPAERAADAVEHVIKFGSDHLRDKEAYKLQWWEFYMLDVLAAIYLVIVTSLFVTFKFLKFVVRRIFYSEATSKRKTD